MNFVENGLATVVALKDLVFSYETIVIRNLAEAN